MLPPDIVPSFLRASVLSILAVLLNGVLLPRLITSRGTRRGHLLWAMISLPFLTPPLLTAYAYTTPFLHLARYPWLEEVAYASLVFLRVYPLALLAGALIPRRLSEEGKHCQALAVDHGLPAWSFRWRHLEPVMLVSALLVFLYAFHEFEMATFLQRPAWTVAMFDAQAQGYALGVTLKNLLPLALSQTVVILALFRLVERGDAAANVSQKSDRSWMIWVYAAVAACLFSIIPVLLILKSAVRGLPSLSSTFSMQREVGDSLIVAFVAGTLGFLLAKGLSQLRSKVLLAVCLMPGLLGTLLLSLGLLGLFQWPGLMSFRDRPIPLVVGLVLALLPLLTLLAVLAQRRDQSDASWSAQLMGTRRLCWAYGRGPYLAVWACGFYLAYFDVTMSKILAPASMTPIMGRLYDLMHYGRDTMLSAYVLVAVAVPFCILALATALGYGLTSRRG